MEPRLSQHQKLLQKMALTPQMRQAIKLLGMSTKDLNEYIDSVAASNPFLQKLLTTPPLSKTASHRVGGMGMVRQERQVQSKENPREVLIAQVRMSGLEGKPLEVAEYLIYEMDDNGYIAVDLEEAANELFASIEEAQEALDAIQGLEPAGIGAADVRECLQLQLRRMGKEDSLEYTIVTDFINEIARNDAQKIADALNIAVERAKKAINSIKKLNPRPASTLLSKGSEITIPDLVARIKDKKVTLEINREWLPRLRLYNPYEDKLEIVKDPEAKKFLKENMEAAKGLIDSLTRREETMCKVAEYVLNVQKETFTKDKGEIKSLTLSDVAAALKLHPSTISRTISNKYIQINDKVIPLNTLLSHGIKKENGEITSKTAIKKRIEGLAKNEDKAWPLSDSKIQKLLEQDGIKIKRRTVAKYRESLRILPSPLRRQK